MSRVAAGSLALCTILATAGCNHLPGKPAPGPEVPRPEAVLSPKILYANNCAGCHGEHGLYGASTPLASPVYQAIVDDATLVRVVAQGRPGTMMPAFSRSFGGDLTEEQVNAIVRGMRDEWRHGDPLSGQSPPPYADQHSGDAKAGAQVYTNVCARCHGPIGGKAGPSGSVLNPWVLSLMSSQAQRTTVIVGRPDLGMPDWRGLVPGYPLTNEQITNVVAFLNSERPTQSPAEHSTGPEKQQRPSHQQEMSGGIR